MTALYLHEDAKELLAGKTLVVIGDSVERSVYKDLVCLLQENRYLTDQELRKKGEESFIGDELIYGGVKGEMKNSIDYRECRYFKADNEACCRYYFVTICYGDYIEKILQELSLEPTDIIVMNSCLWDVHRHGKKGIEKYEENLEKLVASLRRLLPDCLFIWLTTPPVHIKSKGGFLMRPGTDVVKINEVKFCNEIAREVFTNANNIDRRFRIVDLDAVFQFFEHHRAGDGVHWNERAHRRMSNMILEEISKAFNKTVPRVLGRYDSMWDEGNRPHNEYENFNDPLQPMQTPWREDYDQDMNWGPPHPPHLPPDVWQTEPYHDNGWDYGPMGPPPPPHPHGFPPFGPPMPFGPRHPLPPGLLPDLDDLGQARHLVEYQEECRKRKNRDENESESSNVPEKKYRFGATSPRKTDSKKVEDTAKKITIVEDGGVMKKLVELNDGVVCHSVMSEKEVETYRKEQQEKERKEKEKQEREEKERIEKEEKARKEEEKRKKAIEEEKNKPILLKKAISVVSKLPLISSIPSYGEEKNKKEEETKEKGNGAMSKIASKLLSFIKKPVDKVLKTDITDSKAAINTPTVGSTPDCNIAGAEISMKADTKETPQLEEVIEERKAQFTIEPVVETPAKLIEDGSIDEDEKPTNVELNCVQDEKIIVQEVPVINIVEKLPNRQLTPMKTCIETSNVSSLKQSSVLGKPIESAKPVDTFALLSSLSSPFAKPKTKQAVDAAKVKPNYQKSHGETKGDDEDALLGDVDENCSDVDESILEDNHLENPAAQATPSASTTAVLTSNSPKLPTVSKKQVTTPTAKTPRKKKDKKKDKHPNETKEERRIRKAKKKEKKEKDKVEKEAKKKKQNAGGEKLQSISTVAGNTSNPQWNLPSNSHGPAPRQRSATWAPSYYPTYNNAHQQQRPQVQQQPNVVQNPVVLNSTYRNNQIAQQVVTPSRSVVNANAPQQQQQLYIDEYGQTYTLEEETYVVGPTGQIETLNRTATPTNYLQQQTHQQQQVRLQQQQYTTQLLYAQQHATRYL